MSVTENDVRNAYRFVLGREPESADVIQFWKAHADSWPELRQYFLQSEEYKIKNPVPTAKKSASHEDFYLKNCGEDFFWCIRSDGDDNVSQAIKTTGRWEETEELKTIAQRLRNNNKSGGTVRFRREYWRHQRTFRKNRMACHLCGSWLQKRWRFADYIEIE